MTVADVRGLSASCDVSDLGDVSQVEAEFRGDLGIGHAALARSMSSAEVSNSTCLIRTTLAIEVAAGDLVVVDRRIDAAAVAERFWTPTANGTETPGKQSIVTFAGMYTAPHTESGTERTWRGSLGAQVYADLKHRLLMGDFGLGHRLGETALAERLDVSRTPVREALSRLHAEGLVEHLPEGGFVPVAPDLHSISELYEIRRSLEFTAITRGEHDRTALEELADDWAAMVPPASDDECGPDFVLADESFHVRLAHAAGNFSLVDFLVSVNERIRIVRMHDFLTADRVSKTISEHHQIVSHLLERRPKQARESLSVHLEVSERVVEQRAALALSRMIGKRRND